MHFGTDGIREKADKFTPEFLTKLVQGLVNYGGDNIKVFLAGDTRESTEWILQDLANALETFGIEHGSAGVLPTPAINYCFYQMGFDFAIDVTASHNPYTDNGIKILERGKNCGEKLCEKGRAIIEEALKTDTKYDTISSTLREDLHDDALDLYKQHLRDYIGKVDFSNLHFAMDCANGATSVVNKSIFEEFGATVDLLHVNESYNTEINKDCGSTHLDPLAKHVVENHLDFGVAFDGDGDRCLAVDAEGNEVDGDQMLAFLSQFLKLDSIVTTVMANQGLLNWTKDAGIHAEITAVGDPNVVAAMLKNNIKIGSEQNGHVILPEHTSGDGMLTALMIVKAISESQKSLKELASIITKYPQVIVNAEVSTAQKSAFAASKPAQKLLDEYTTKLSDVEGRLLVRPSGTENLLRITMWGNNKDTITTLANELKDKIGEIL